MITILLTIEQFKELPIEKQEEIIRIGMISETIAANHSVDIGQFLVAAKLVAQYIHDTNCYDIRRLLFTKRDKLRLIKQNEM